MKLRHQVLRVLPVVMLVCGLLSESAQAQFTQQEAKLVDTGVAGVGRGCTISSGLAVALSGDGNTAIIGGVGDNYPAGPGAAWVYTRSGGVWSRQAKLVGTGAIGQAEQGCSVALSGDGNTAIVGGPGDNLHAGAAWVYTRSAGVWSQQGAKLVGTGASPIANQGISVALSGDGNTAIVGGPVDVRPGAAWVYTRSAGVWSQQGAKLVGTGATSLGNQGWSVALSSDGNTAIVGGPGDNYPAGPGAAWVYTRSAGVWSQQGAKLVGTGALGFEQQQGISVALSGDGNTGIVGGWADNSNAGAVWVYTRSGGVWSQQGAKLVGTGAIGQAEQGNSVSLSSDGNTTVVGGLADNGGVGAAWVFIQPVFAGTPGKANCHGKSVSALAKQFGGLNAAAATLGYPSIPALQDAILAFCEG